MSALSLLDAKTHLNITTPVNDAEVQSVIDAAEAIIATEVGPLTQQTQRTDRVAAAGVSRIVLPIAPVVSVSSVTSPDGTVVDLTTATVNGDAGLIYFTDGVTRFWSTYYDVTYSPGRATVPGDLLFAIKQQVRHMWRTQRGPGAGPGSGPQEQPSTGRIPPEVQEYLEPYRLVGIGAA